MTAKRPDQRRALAWLRADPAAFLPALLALMLAAASLPARAHLQMVMSCAGRTLPTPGQPPVRDCDIACHVGCTRTKRP